jgi:hypothetical protein
MNQDDAKNRSPAFSRVRAAKVSGIGANRSQMWTESWH